MLAAILTLFMLKTGVFGGSNWSMNLPDDFVDERTAPPISGMSTTAFTTKSRSDGTRPLIQVTLANRTDLRKFAEEMIGGVRRRREQWEVAESETTIGDLKVIRYEWSGVAVPLMKNARRVGMSGVMFVGVQGDVAFALHTQDIDAFSEETLPAAEKTMRTFRLQRD